MRGRARVLRDQEVGAWGDRHLWVSVHASRKEELDSAVESIRGSAPLRFGAELRGAAIVRGGDWYEHFGFRDDIANPVMEGSHLVRRPKALAGNGKRDEAGSWVPLKAGEFVLGYPNESNEIHPGNELLPLFKNGTFAVFRDLEQHVEAFRGYVTRQAAALKITADTLAAKIVGRQRDGTPLIEPKETPNDFDFEADREGRQCPLGAHVRRVNHRARKESEGGRHRLIRRGRPYGEPLTGTNGGDAVAQTSSPRGLYFIGLNASIADQFEFIQRRWINDRASIDEDLDPLVGVGASRLFAIEGQDPPLTLVDIPDFVTFRGGEYYFVPGISALAALSEQRSAI
jgi:Dyp-type peroxidase family